MRPERRRGQPVDRRNRWPKWHGLIRKWQQPGDPDQWRSRRPARGYDQLMLSGNVNLTGVNLLLSGTSIPAIGDQFMIVNNSLAAGLTVDTFTRLPEGEIFNPLVGVAS